MPTLNNKPNTIANRDAVILLLKSRVVVDVEVLNYPCIIGISHFKKKIRQLPFYI